MDNFYSILHHLWKHKASVFSVILQKKYILHNFSSCVPLKNENHTISGRWVNNDQISMFGWTASFNVLDALWLDAQHFTVLNLRQRCVHCSLLRVWCTVNHTVITLYSFIQTFLPHNTLTLPLVLNLIHEEIKDPAHTRWPQTDRSCSSPISSALPEQPCEGATAH